METKKIIAWGDIHGQADAAKAAIQITESLDAVAIFLGDYIDRGPKSIQTLLQLIKAKEEHPDWVFLRGNHENMILPLLEQPYSQDNLMMSFDIDTYRDFYELTDLQQQQVIDFIKSTAFYHETESFLFCHAPLKDYENSLDEVDKSELLRNYDLTPYWKGKPFIHGHKPIIEPEFSLNGLNINTCCGMGGFLTGILIPDNLYDPFEFFKLLESGEVYEKYKLPNLHSIKNN